MLRLARFIKPFLGSVALAIVLLFIQAICDLNLPNLMSNIVNVGIQQGGVEDRSPVALSGDAYELTTAFMDSHQLELVEDNYELVLPGSLDPSGKPWSDRYPSASAEGLYVLREGVDADTRAHLDQAFGLATWTMVGVLREFSENGIENLGIELPPGAAEQMLAGGAGADTNDSDTTDGNGISANISDIDFSAISEVLPLIKMIPPTTMAIYQAKAGEVDELMRNESATMLTRNFYVELGVNMEEYEIGYIVRVGLIMLLITVIGGTATVLVGLLSSRAGAGLARNLRSAIFSKVLSFSHTEFDRFSTASLITRSTNDISQIQILVTMGIRMLFYAPIMGLGAVFMALQKSVSMSWIMGIAVLFMLCVVVVLMIIVMPKFRIIQKLIDRLNLVARESLNGQMVIRAFSRAPFEMERFDKANVDVTKTNLFIQRAMVFMMPIMMIFMNALTILIIWIGAEQVAASTMQVGDMMAYMQYAMMVVMSFMFIAMAFIFVPRAAVSAGRIADVLETQPLITSPENPVSLSEDLPAGKRGRVELVNVSFSYEGAEAPALDGINFVAEPGETTAIIGSTGSGKSTILSLIPRFYDASEGAVLFDGVDVRDLAIDDLRGRIGYVPQKSLLLSGSVAKNISYGNPSLLPEDLTKVAEVAQALDFISALGAEDEILQHSATPNAQDDKGVRPAEDQGLGPSAALRSAQDDGEGAGGLAPSAALRSAQDDGAGFGFEIAQGGSNVSGGQRQRLAIARALAINPEVFLFDDSFSALDFATDAALRKALASYTKDATLIIVAQRVSTIMNAERIYMVDEGRVIAQGTHAELLRTCPQYREVAETQLSPEEIAAALRSALDDKVGAGGLDSSPALGGETP
ncbi:MAG: ABC transporter ATP-binding protein/permease [Coriobacteriia bacterium]|nr:ABC transporter ATP-binding protein/permease [Coriobacteriia bacterium]